MKPAVHGAWRPRIQPSSPARRLLVLGACASCIPLARAHGLELVAVADGTRVIGRAWYDDDTPARGHRVTLSLASAPQVLLAAATTDAEGRFSVEAPTETRLLVVVEGDEGHVTEVAVLSGRADTPGRTGAASGSDAAAMLRAELLPLREDIARLERWLRRAGAAAGLGAIVAGAGAWTLWRGRRR